MSNKSGVTSQVLPLPQGGGALAGIGESFSPDLFTGTGNVTVPLALPPGRNGFAPTLNLAYSTGTGAGPFGLGWDLAVPQVSRKTAKGVPRYRDGAADPGQHDTFVLSGEDLVQTGEPAQGVTGFRPRTEGRFARIEHVRTGQEDLWRVSDRNGAVSLFGATVAGSDPATVADPAARTRIYAWKLAQTSDTFGNRIQYRYLRDSAPGGARTWDQLYLEQVRYVDYDHEGQEHFLVSVGLVYAERPDAFSSHRAGFEVRTRLRCQRIEVHTHPAPDQDTLVRTYELVYADERAQAGELDPSALPANGTSLLSQIRIVGHDGDRTEQLPPLEFGYTGFEPARARFQPFTAPGGQLPPRSLSSKDFDLVSLFGNGLPDIVQMNGAAQFWRNLGGGAFDRPAPMPEIPAAVRLGDPGVQVADMNGDGRADLLVLADSGYFPLSFQGRWGAKDFVRYTSSPSVSFNDQELRLVDLDGDGVVDALRTGERFELFFNDPTRGWGIPETRSRQPIEQFPDVSFADPRVKLADLTGDGLQDCVLVDQGRIDYWPFLGHGRWGPRVTMTHSPVLHDTEPPTALGFDPRRVLLGDVDGDGLDDLVYVEPGRITVWINQSGNSWSDPIPLDKPPTSFTGVDAVRLADMLGAGTAGVLWTTDQTPADRTYQFLDLTRAAKPYLLDRMDNHRGAITHVGYAPSTHFYQADEGSPATRWTTPLPFPVQTVQRVEAIDLISGGKLATEYRYHHGYWDGAEREFRGFGMVEQLDSETFDRFNEPGLHGQQTPFNRVEQVHFTPPTLTKTWFHLGPVGDESRARHEADFTGEYWPGDPPALGPTAEPPGLPASGRADALRALRGSVLRTELYARDETARQERPYTVTETRFALREEPPPAPGGPDRKRAFFPHQIASRVTQWERGDEPMVQFSFTDDYDQHGQPRTRIQIACPRGWRDATTSRSSAYLASYTTTAYAGRDDDKYIVDRVATQTTVEIGPGGAEPERTLAELRSAILDDSAARRVIAQTVNHYDGEPFTGRPAGEVGDFGALMRTESLVLTPEILHEAYESGDAASDAARVPPYLAPDNPPNWSDEYPSLFRDQLPPLAGYTFLSGDPARGPGYFTQTVRRRYDVHDNPISLGRGLVKTTRDPLGRDTTITYDRFDLFPQEVIDPVGLRTQAGYDYRVLQPQQITDPNGNRVAVAFTPLGLVERSAVMGKEGETLGDSLQAPGTRLVYDFLAFANSPPDRRQPISVRTIRRTHHVNDLDVPPAVRDQLIEKVEYSDGFGRLIQIRAQAEDELFGNQIVDGAVLPAAQDDPATLHSISGQRNDDPARPNVVVSGLQIHDNKGRVVEKYEPYFATGWAFSPATGLQLGQRVRLFYDPRGQVLRSVNPDGSEQRIVFGIPLELANPDQFDPTPWEAFTYDANDNAGRTNKDDARSYEHHWDTPASVTIDALGRVVLSTQRTRAPRPLPGDPLPPVEELQTQSAYDIRGNVVSVTDALGRPACRHVYDLADRPLRIQSIDSGTQHIVLDAANNEIERRDSKGALTLHAVDRLNRPSRLWARDDNAGAVTLRERLEYGDGGNPDQPEPQRAASRATNRLGRLHKHYDEAGLLTLTLHDFKGNVVEKTRQAISDTAILAVFPSPGDPTPDWHVSPFHVDWQPPDGTTLDAHSTQLLDPTIYETSTTYDALNRVKILRYPRDADGERKMLRTAYNRAGALEHVHLDDVTFVERIAYNANGQRVLIVSGNGVMTRYTYDPATFRLIRMRTERFTSGATSTYQPTGPALQDFAYAHDLSGNLLELRDRTPGSGLPSQPDRLDRTFGYDPLYRLRSATGREQAGPPPTRPWDAAPKSQDPNLTRTYAESYDYDRVGNLLALRHAAGTGSFTRTFGLADDGGPPAPVNDGLKKLTVGSTVFDYTQDHAGNLTSETTSRHFQWDHANRMSTFRIQVSGSEPSVYVHYLYDSTGNRTKKLVRKQGGQVETTTYLDGTFEQHRQGQGAEARKNTSVHVMDEARRIAIVRVGAAFPKDATPAVKYHFGDHITSSNVVIDDEGAWVNREEFTPYGETSFGSFAYKRYRFTSKERDEESGHYYHGARYYAPYLCRWTSCDPAGIGAGLNAYQYVRGNPIAYVDPTGRAAEVDNTVPVTLMPPLGVGETSPIVAPPAVVDPRDWALPAALGPSAGPAARAGNDQVSQGLPLVPLRTDIPEVLEYYSEQGRPEILRMADAALKRIAAFSTKSAASSYELIDIDRRLSFPPFPPIQKADPFLPPGRLLPDERVIDTTDTFTFGRIAVQSRTIVGPGDWRDQRNFTLEGDRWVEAQRSPSESEEGIKTAVGFLIGLLAVVATIFVVVLGIVLAGGASLGPALETAALVGSAVSGIVAATVSLASLPGLVGRQLRQEAETPSPADSTGLWPL